jgi:hypothetical protein
MKFTVKVEKEFLMTPMLEGYEKNNLLTSKQILFSQ